MADDTRSGYMREYRKTPSGRAQLDAQNRRAGAKRRALLALAERYPDEFEKLFQAELRAVVMAARERAIRGRD